MVKGLTFLSSTGMESSLIRLVQSSASLSLHAAIVACLNRQTESTSRIIGLGLGDALPDLSEDRFP